jgi:hypothetical protein
MGVRNRSFRIEDDPMGDNFRQSLEDIRVGVRETVPKVTIRMNTYYTLVPDISDMSD